MTPRRHRTRIVRYLRMLPVLGWLLVQVSMAMAPGTAHAAHDPRLAEIAQAIGVAEIELCTPEGRLAVDPRNAPAMMAECDWCQAFSASLQPEAPEGYLPLRRIGDADTRADAAAPQTLPAVVDCHPCRAPPALV